MGPRLRASTVERAQARVWACMCLRVLVRPYVRMHVLARGRMCKG